MSDSAAPNSQTGSPLLGGAPEVQPGRSGLTQTRRDGSRASPVSHEISKRAELLQKLAGAASQSNATGSTQLDPRDSSPPISSLTKQQLLLVLHSLFQHLVDGLRQLVCYDVICHKFSCAASMSRQVSLIAALDCRVASHCDYCRLVEGALEVVVTLFACPAPPAYLARLCYSGHKATV